MDDIEISKSREINLIIIINLATEESIHNDKKYNRDYIKILK
jgi:hypothetical protein